MEEAKHVYSFATVLSSLNPSLFDQRLPCKLCIKDCNPSHLPCITCIHASTCDYSGYTKGYSGGICVQYEYGPCMAFETEGPLHPCKPNNKGARS
jgi:hypothetical protein